MAHDGGHWVKPGLIDITVPNAARASDFLHGGQDHFAADRKAAAALIESAPSVAAFPASARAFRCRVVRYLAADAGIRQFLDVGDGLVPPGNTHEVAQAADPTCRIVYVESDPMVFAHANATLTSAPGGMVSCVDGDIADVDGIVSGAGLSGVGRSGASAFASDVPRPGDGAILDVGQPVAVLLLSTLSHVPSAADAANLVTALMNALLSGSYLAIYHLASDLDPSLVAAIEQWNAAATMPIVLRSSAEIAALVTGLDLVPPGLVPVNDWRPDSSDPPAAAQVPIHGLVARKP
ncbi:SAM-dependent methyltransferase [Trebonia kvetii]|uniref:SAM-dependent methyltransferase n=1 Tax=Trebonia kvetii TaxID=2480626 RepID=A0A6P2BTR1_9ACTN|nr:SAM-dependent methyltransferase [Trebonia kvetii]TVZ01751.1 SAM-dependent methyltransferase [Trebonia kvetii]